jgi:hypothetical protein
MRHCALVLASIAILGPASALAQPSRTQPSTTQPSRTQPSTTQPSTARERVRVLLSGFEDVPSDEAWRGVDNALPALIELYADRSEPAHLRLRAVSAVGAFRQPAARTFLLAVANADGQTDLFVRAAVSALGHAFGRDAVADLTPFLSHRVTVVREAAARSLGRIGDEASRRALRARLGAERDPTVRQAIEHALR